MSRIRIAIDGPASSGKGTVAKKVAALLGYTYIDTGAMYRSVALVAGRQRLSHGDERGIGAVAATLRIDFTWDGHTLRTTVEGEDVSELIRTEEVGRGASDVAALPSVRAALLVAQRDLGARGGVVMDGRDIGTVVLPHAELKVFLDASLDERARRRTLELAERDGVRPVEEIRRELQARDRQDSGRAVAPLKRADDAVYVDTTAITADQAAERIVGLARARGAT